MESHNISTRQHVEPLSVADRLHSSDEVTVMMYDPESRMVYTHTGTGFSSISKAINTTYQGYTTTKDIRDFTFRVTDRTTGTTALYRMNAHDHLHLVV